MRLSVFGPHNIDLSPQTNCGLAVVGGSKICADGRPRILIINIIQANSSDPEVALNLRVAAAVT